MNLKGFFFFFQAEDGIRDRNVTGVQTCALPICSGPSGRGGGRPDGDGSPQALGHVRRDMPDQADLPVLETMRRVFAVQAEHTPALLAGDENRPEFVAKAEWTHDLLVASTGGPVTAG